MKPKGNNSVKTIQHSFQKAERAMSNGELALAFEIIEDILKKIDTGRLMDKTKEWDNGQRAFFMDIINRCIFLKRKLIKEMAKNL
ncbi:MAG: hypothetical protein JW973_07485 [Bacteroidales bacterium]|nr:hypothetical protein [Bacteroidales bacterium]